MGFIISALRRLHSESVPRPCYHVEPVLGALYVWTSKDRLRRLSDRVPVSRLLRRSSRVTVPAGLLHWWKTRVLGQCLQWSSGTEFKLPRGLKLQVLPRSTLSPPWSLGTLRDDVVVSEWAQ